MMSLAATSGVLIQFPFAGLSAGEFNCCRELSYPECRVVIMSQNISFHRSEDLCDGSCFLYGYSFITGDKMALEMYCSNTTKQDSQVLEVKFQYVDP